MTRPSFYASDDCFSFSSSSSSSSALSLKMISMMAEAPSALLRRMARQIEHQFFEKESASSATSGHPVYRDLQRVRQFLAEQGLELDRFYYDQPQWRHSRLVPRRARPILFQEDEQPLRNGGGPARRVF
jgi:hypothetical protein